MPFVARARGRAIVGPAVPYHAGVNEPDPRYPIGRRPDLDPRDPSIELILAT